MEKRSGILPTSVPQPLAGTPDRRLRKPIFFALLLAAGLVQSFSWTSNSRNLSLDVWQTSFASKYDLGKKHDVEQLFLSLPHENGCRETSRKFAEYVHMAGTPGDLETAKLFLREAQKHLHITPTHDLPIYDAGTEESRNSILDISHLHSPKAWIDTYYPVMNTPGERSLQALNKDGSVLLNIELEEPYDPTDPAGKLGNAVPAFHGFSADGEAIGKLIFANYGSKEDYDRMSKEGVNFTDTIVLAQYGANVRGLKIKGAEELGAVGVLMYDDPADDHGVTVENGYKAYPHGPARNQDAIQRGSVEYIQEYPGDPTTPGLPAYKNATRVEPRNLASIPSLPLSPRNAKALLDLLKEGKWDGTLKMVNRQTYAPTAIWSPMVVIPGYIKSEAIVIGNHRDAWVLGAADPISGTASMLEVVHAFGQMMKTGWKPLRTIIVASWDAEEYGLISSTEWGEDFAEWLQDHVVAYLNLDVSVAGSRFAAQASPAMAHLVRQAAMDVPHPTDGNRTLWDATKDIGIFPVPPNVSEKRRPTKIGHAEDHLGIGVLGSGSDFTVFLQRLGISSMSHGFSAAGDDAVAGDAVYHYHSIYDSFRWMELYGDPGFSRHVAVAKHLGLMALRLVDSVILPLNVTHYAFELENYLDQVAAIATDTKGIDLKPLRNSMHSLQKAALSFESEQVKSEKELLRAIDAWKHDSVLHRAKEILREAYCKIQKALGHPCEPIKDGNHPLQDLKNAMQRIQAINQKLMLFERGFLSESGIQGREWYKHLGVAPGKWLGYGATTLPGLTEAITIEHNTTLAQVEAGRLQTIVLNLAESLEI